mmetsp:Transcript_16506/g.36182  ORF Transcript_16506/g.36182 Transcript_16506/m.36182 type:complete len:202 (+) Transcript_16506:957-1562(+)
MLETRRRQLPEATFDLKGNVAVRSSGLDHVPAPDVALSYGGVLLLRITVEQLAHTRDAVRILHARNQRKAALVGGGQSLLQKLCLGLWMPEVHLDAAQGLTQGAPVQVFPPTLAEEGHPGKQRPSSWIVVELEALLVPAGCLQLHQAFVQPLLAHVAQVPGKANAEEEEVLKVASLHDPLHVFVARGIVHQPQLHQRREDV